MSYELKTGTTSDFLEDSPLMYSVHHRVSTCNAHKKYPTLHEHHRGTMRGKKSTIVTNEWAPRKKNNTYGHGKYRHTATHTYNRQWATDEEVLVVVTANMFYLQFI